MKTEMKVPNECLYPTDVFLISCGMGCKRITVTDIAYIEAMKDNCIIHMVDGKRYTQSCPMGDIEPELNPDMFKRIHRSFIVNIRYIDMYYYGHVVLENGFVNYKKSFNARKITKKVIIVDFQGIITDYHYKMLFL